MSSQRRSLRRAFSQKAYRLVRVTSDGFLVDGEPHAELAGHVTRTQLIRKLFRHGILECDSRDGEHSRSGKPCDSCQHPACRPQLRIHLTDGPLIHVLDLWSSPARQLFDLEDAVEAQGGCLEDVRLTFTVVKTGRWGEIVIRPSSNPTDPPRGEPAGTAATELHADEQRGPPCP